MTDHQQTPRPFPESYWVVPGRLLAAEYPRTLDDAASIRKLRAIVASGVRTFVDLTTEDDPLMPYEHLLTSLPAEASDRVSFGVRRLSFPVMDMGVPDPEQAAAILDAIDASIEDGGSVYLHCWGGIGRTGTIAGCWLARHGPSGDLALERLNELWQVNPKRHWWPYIPQTPEQIEFVRNWSETSTDRHIP